jgi:soluble lytic murein transglycosylase-like protein
MQLMPATAARYGVRDLFDPVENIAGGVRYLRDLLGLFGGDLPKSLAAYNAGEAAVLRYGGVPPYEETQLYVRKGMTAYYGKATLTGGFGRPRSETWSARPARPVRVTRDKNNRPVITTDLASRPALRG